MNDPRFTKALGRQLRQAAPTGSRVICNPPPTDTDEDIVVLVRNTTVACQQLLDAGFDATVNDDYDIDGFVSLRRGALNLIVTKDESFYSAFVAATHVAQKLNLLNKADRVSLFQAVLYRNCA